MEEAGRRVGEHAEPRGALAGIEGVEGGPVGVAVLLGDEAIKVESRVVVERMDELADLAAIDDDVGMDAASFVARAIAAEKADEARSAPAAVADCVAEEEVVATEGIAVAGGIGGNEALDFTCQGGSDALVGIDD